MNLTSIFFDRLNRPRSGWRFLIFLLAFALTGLVVGTLSVGVLAMLAGSAAPGTAVFLVINGVASLAAALLVGWICGRLLEDLPFRALGAAAMNGWLRNLLFGLVIGSATFALAALIGVTGGGLRFNLNTEAELSGIFSTLAASFAVFAVAAAFEEALFRGYILQTFVRSDLTIFAVLFTSAVFAAVHNANPSVTTLSWLNTFFAGIWFAAAYLKTRDLWLAFGLHLAWNWTQGSIFGVEVSGLSNIVKAPIMREADSGPAWLTGGDYGLEGGIACTIALIVSTLAVYFLPLPRPSQDLLALTSPPSTPAATIPAADL